MRKIAVDVDPNISCSQYAIANTPDMYLIDKALAALRASPTHIELDVTDDELLVNDLVFYTTPTGFPSHVAKVVAPGLLESKFHQSTEVVQHELWEQGVIPNGWNYLSHTVIRELADPYEQNED